MMPFRSTDSPEGGFTIFELMMAILIIVVMLAVALPKMSAAVSAHRVISTVRKTASYVRLVRATAIARNAPARLVLSEGGKVLTMQVQKAGVWTAAASEMPLEKGVVVSAAPDPIVFQPQGTATSPATILITGETGASREIGVTILGSVEIY